MWIIHELVNSFSGSRMAQGVEEGTLDENILSEAVTTFPAPLAPFPTGVMQASPSTYRNPPLQPKCKVHGWPWDVPQQPASSHPS